MNLSCVVVRMVSAVNARNADDNCHGIMYAYARRGDARNLITSQVARNTAIQTRAYKLSQPTADRGISLGVISEGRPVINSVVQFSPPLASCTEGVVVQIAVTEVVNAFARIKLDVHTAAAIGICGAIPAGATVTLTCCARRALVVKFTSRAMRIPCIVVVPA
jgi:hypothetical protein